LRRDFFDNVNRRLFQNWKYVKNASVDAD